MFKFTDLNPQILKFINLHTPYPFSLFFWKHTATFVLPYPVIHHAKACLTHLKQYRMHALCFDVFLSFLTLQPNSPNLTNYENKTSF
jgi:hypothetical protein